MPPKLRHQIDPRQDILEILDLHAPGPFEIIRAKNAAAKACFRAKGGAKSLPTLVEGDDSPTAVAPSVSGSLQHPRTASRLSILRHNNTRVRRSFDDVAVVTPSTPTPSSRRKMICTPTASTSNLNKLDVNNSPSEILPMITAPTFYPPPSNILPSALSPPRIRILRQPSLEFTRHYSQERLAPAGILPSLWDTANGHQLEHSPPANFEPGLTSAPNVLVILRTGGGPERGSLTTVV